MKANFILLTKRKKITKQTKQTKQLYETMMKNHSINLKMMDDDENENI